MTLKIINNMRHTACPLCNSTALTSLGPIRYHTPTLYSSHEIELTHQPEMWRCTACSSCFTQNMIPERTAQDLYSSGASQTRWGGTPFETTKTPESVAVLSGLLKKGVRLLDIGSNAGELLNFAKARGCDTAGVEFSVQCRELLRKNGHNAYLSLPDTEGTFDIITAFDLFEHLYDAHAFLVACGNRLSNNGRLIIVTGDVECLSSQLSGARWWYARYPEHILFPSYVFFSRIPGFTIETVHRTYSSTGYKRNFWIVALGLLASCFRGGYGGIPSIGPDHKMIVLKKQAVPVV